MGAMFAAPGLTVEGSPPLPDVDLPLDPGMDRASTILGKMGVNDRV